MTMSDDRNNNLEGGRVTINSQLIQHAKSVASSGFDYFLVFGVLFLQTLVCTPDISGTDDFLAKSLKGMILNGTLSVENVESALDKVNATLKTYKDQFECAE
eukprot:4157357-Ditylum_brightwellii.AAC.1